MSNGITRVVPANSVTVRFGSAEINRDYVAGASIGSVVNNPVVKASLGLPDNRVLMVHGVTVSETSPVSPGMVITVERAQDSKG